MTQHRQAAEGFPLCLDIVSGEAGNSEIVVLDKTGTITRGEPEVTDIFPAEGIDETDLLETAYALEGKSEHPLATAIVRKAEELDLDRYDVLDFQALPGNGLSAVLDDETILGGSMKYIAGQITVPDPALKAAEALAAQGKTPLLFVREKEYIGTIAVADVMKDDSAEAIRELKDMGVHVVMLTGDNEKTAQAIGTQAGVDEVIADVLPDGKEAVIRMLQEKGKVAMVGDGINDAPALTRADIGIAIGAGTDVAIDAADIVLMKSRLSDVAAAIRLSRETYKNILENLFWALIYNSLLIPLAAGVYVKSLGLTMNPMLGAAAMSLSSFCVVTNALRLNLMNIYDPKHDKKIKHKKRSSDPLKTYDPERTIKEETKEEEIMKKTLTIEGMMCPHCEASVKKALEELDGVLSAEVSHEAGTAVVSMNDPVADEVLKSAVEAKDYTVTGIE